MPEAMMTIFNVIAWLLKAILTDKAQLAAENIALRQQIVVFKRHAKRPRLQKSDRLFWIWLSALWKEWRFVLTIVKPETVIKWHRQGFRHLWRWTVFLDQHSADGLRIWASSKLSFLDSRPGRIHMLNGSLDQSVGSASIT